MMKGPFPSVWNVFLFKYDFWRFSLNLFIVFIFVLSLYFCWSLSSLSLSLCLILSVIVIVTVFVVVIVFFGNSCPLKAHKSLESICWCVLRKISQPIPHSVTMSQLILTLCLASLEILARIIKFCPRDLHWQPISVKVSLKSSGKLKLGFSSNIFHTMLFLSAIGRTLDHQMLLRREDGEGPP